MGNRQTEGYVMAFRYMTCVHRLTISVPVLSEIEACTFRNKTPEETAEYMKSILDKYMPMRSGTSKSPNLQDERKKDHYSHFILRLAFSATEDLRRRFSRLETMLFQLRFKDDDHIERQKFVRSLNLEWEEVQEAEKIDLKNQLLAAAGGGMKNREEQEWFKVDWERVPMLVEQRRVFVKWGKAYVPQREQMSLVVAEFTKQLDAALEVCPLVPYSLRHRTNNATSLHLALSPVSTKTIASLLSSLISHNPLRHLMPPTLRQMLTSMVSPP